MAAKKKGNWIGIAIVVALFLVYAYITDESTPTKPVTNQTPVADSSGVGRLNSYGLNGVRDDWPNMADASALDLQDKLAKNYYVILDDSGSMKSNVCAKSHVSRLSAAIDALSAFAEGLPQLANLGVMSFDGGRFSELLPIGKQSPMAIGGLSQRMMANGNTPLATAITRGYEALRQQASAQLGYGEYHLVVITDGEASEGEYPDKIIERILTESPVDIHTIGFCIGEDHVLNQPRYLSYQAADDVQALRQGLQDVLAEAPTFTVSSFE
jgi:Mg-chelatase subunit ChlD